MPALFITFEGIDYSGKTLQSRLLSEHLQAMQLPVLTLRDPGATRISEKIRDLLLDETLAEMAPITELLLYEAARSQMVEQLIKPALAQGRIVIADRFYDSTTAYQGFARGLDLELVQAANRIGRCGLTPDHTFLLDLDPAIALQRKRAVGRDADRIEQEGLSFQQRVRAGYLHVAKMEPNRISVIEGNDAAEVIQQRILDIFIQRFSMQVSIH